MKKNSLLKSTLLLGAAVAFISCVTEKEKVHYIDLNQVYCSFLAGGDQEVEIDVRAVPSWEANSNAIWLKAAKISERKLAVTVDENDSNLERAGIITVVAGDALMEIKVNQFGKEDEFARFRMADKFQMGGAISPSGKYVGGFITTISSDDSYQFQPTIIDTETGEITQWGPISTSIHALHQTMCISDQGTLFMVDGENGGTVVCTLDGDIYKVDTPEGFQFQPQIQGTSADGKYWVGYCINAPVGGDEGGLNYPILWTDGVPEVLPMPEKNYREEEIWCGVMARGISANGEVIYGTSWENNDFGMLYWKNGKVEWVGKDVREVKPVRMKSPDGTTYDYTIVNGMICQSELTKISSSGKWIASSYRTETLNEDMTAVILEQYAAFYNTETETTVIVEDYGTSVGSHVTDEGIAFIGIGNFGISSGRVYDLNTKRDLGSTEEWVYANYGIHIPMGYVNYVSPDGKIVFGTSMQSSAGGIAFVNWYVAPPIGKVTGAL